MQNTDKLEEQKVSQMHASVTITNLNYKRPSKIMVGSEGFIKILKIVIRLQYTHEQVAV